MYSKISNTKIFCTILIVCLIVCLFVMVNLITQNKKEKRIYENIILCKEDTIHQLEEYYNYVNYIHLLKDSLYIAREIDDDDLALAILYKIEKESSQRTFIVTDTMVSRVNESILQWLEYKHPDTYRYYTLIKFINKDFDSLYRHSEYYLMEQEALKDLKKKEPKKK